MATLQAFREAVVELSCTGTSADARDRLVVVPTRAAAAHLLRSIEDAHLPDRHALLLPDFVTRDEVVRRLADRLPPGLRILTPAEREVLLGVAARQADAEGFHPPFQLRPGLVAEMLRFYDELRRHRNSIDDFERRALERLQPGAEYDRGAERLVRQTRFLVAAFRGFEVRAAAAGDDEHRLRDRLLAEPAVRPWRHAVVTVSDRAFDPYGLYPMDWDLLARIPQLTSLDVVVTDTVLAGALHERMHTVLPGVEEVRFEPAVPAVAPTLLIPVPTADAAPIVHTARDREEEVALFARRVKHGARSSEAPLERIALAVQQPLPYVYVAREVLRSAGIPCQMFDALPLAAEPFAAALDLLFSAVTSSFGRVPVIALLQSPHFRFEDGGGERVSARDLSALDRALAEAGYLGDIAGLERLVESWQAATPQRGLLARAVRAGRVLLDVERELGAFRSPQPVADHLQVLLRFLAAHEHLPGPEDPLRTRQLRARGGILGTLNALQQAYAQFDAAPADFDHVAALARRWIDAQTFQPRSGDRGVHLVDAASARYGRFDEVQLAGLVDGEWPERPRRNIFYSPSLLRDLGWPAESDRLDGARTAFVDLLQLPAQRLVLSTFSLEADAIVTPSLLVEEAERLQLPAAETTIPSDAIFDYERLVMEGGPEGPPLRIDRVGPTRRNIAVDPRLDIAVGSHLDGAAPLLLRRGGPSGPPAVAPAPGPPAVAPPSGPPAVPLSAQLPAYSLSALERYQDCPFKFFAADILKLEEAPEDESTLSPRARGRFIHEVFQRFFEAWDARGAGTISSDRLDAARALFRDVAEPLLARLPDADAALERTRLFGSAISVGIVDVVLGIEASRPVTVQGRLLEYRLEGEFSIGGPGGARVALKGVADRIDLLDGHRLRVIDYKSGSAPNPRRALQVPIYALCAQERLTERDGVPWAVDEAAYVAFTGKRTLVPVVKAGADPEPALQDARARLFAALDGIAGSEFPPRPHDEMICRWCAYASVCRKDYVGDE